MRTEIPAHPADPMPGPEGICRWCMKSFDDRVHMIPTPVPTDTSDEHETIEYPLAQIMIRYRPGSQDWSWKEEMSDMFSPAHFDKTVALIHSIRKDGIKEPIALGDDRRIWDGHHRITAAYVLGLKIIPTIELGGSQ